MPVGWRARLGYITPADTLETPFYEFIEMAPDGVVMVGSCLNINQITVESVDEAWAKVAGVAAGLANYAVDCVIVGGGLLSYLKGPGAHLALAEVVTTAARVPAVTAMGASLDAIRQLGIDSVAVASPLEPESNAELAAALEAEGVRVLSMEGTTLASNAAVAMLPSHASYQAARSAFRKAPAADGIYIVGARWQVSPSIAVMEDDFGVPVVASVQSTMWSALNHLGIRPVIAGYGRLLAGA